MVVLGPIIGRQNIPLNIKIKEYQEITRNGLVEKSKHVQHYWFDNHHKNFEEAKIVHWEPHFLSKLIEVHKISRPTH